VWRREHQWQAQQAHRQRHTRQLATASLADASLDVPAALTLVGLPPLTLARWEHIASLLPPQRPPTGRPASDHRQILEGMLWVMAAGTSWRQLPSSFGPWQTIYSRFQRWKREGLWEQIRTILLASNELSL
jgi:transposase